MEPPIVVFDGVCVLCNRFVRFVDANDPPGRMRFLASQRAGDAIVLLAGGRRYEGSDAVLHLLLELRWPWPLGFAAILIPGALRDAVYRWVARNRYNWFGRYDACPLPPPGLRARFLNDPN